MSIYFSVGIGKVYNLLPRLVPSVVLGKHPDIFEGLPDVHPPGRRQEMVNRVMDGDLVSVAISQFRVEVQIAGPEA